MAGPGGWNPLISLLPVASRGPGRTVPGITVLMVTGRTGRAGRVRTRIIITTVRCVFQRRIHTRMIRPAHPVRSISAPTGVAGLLPARTAAPATATAYPRGMTPRPRGTTPRPPLSRATPLFQHARPARHTSPSMGAAVRRTASSSGFPAPGTAGRVRARRSTTTVRGVWSVRSFRIRAARPVSSTTTRTGVAGLGPVRTAATISVGACGHPIRLRHVRVVDAYRHRSSPPLRHVEVVRSTSPTGSPGTCMRRDAARRCAR